MGKGMDGGQAYGRDDTISFYRSRASRHVFTDNKQRAHPRGYQNDEERQPRFTAMFRAAL